MPLTIAFTSWSCIIRKILHKNFSSCVKSICPTFSTESCSVAPFSVIWESLKLTCRISPECLAQKLPTQRVIRHRFRLIFLHAQSELFSTCLESLMYILREVDWHYCGGSPLWCRRRVSSRITKTRSVESCGPVLHRVPKFVVLRLRDSFLENKETVSLSLEN